MKKIIKKKLDDMTEDEVKRIEQKYCHSVPCKECPLRVGIACLSSFPYWKHQYESNKDKEFDVEVEE